MSDPNSSRVSPRISLSPLEGRLYIVALLASGYLFVWRAIDATSSSSAMVTDPITEVARPQSSPGDPAMTVPAPRVTRIPASRPMRVRTRSS